MTPAEVESHDAKVGRSDRLAALVCPRCRVPLGSNAAERVCPQCGRRYPVDPRGQVNLREGANADAGEESEYLEGLRGRLRRSAVYPLVFRLLAPVLVTGPDPVRVLGSELSDGVVVDLGSGNDRRHPAFTTVDILPYPEVDVVCDGDALPFADGSVAGVTSIVVMEHVPRPQPVFDEIARIVRPSGKVFIVVPFLQPFHAAPHDYRRWTLPGLEEELSDHFEVIERGVYCGPASAMTWLLADFVSLALSFGSTRLQELLRLPMQALFSPLKWFDLLLARLPGASNVASAIHLTAQRRA